MEDVILGIVMILFFLLCGFAVSRAGRYMNRIRRNSCGQSCSAQYSCPGLVGESSADMLNRTIKRAKKRYGQNALMVLMVFTVKDIDQSTQSRSETVQNSSILQ